MGLHLLPYGIKNKELQRIGSQKSRVNSSLPGTSLASMESLSLPLMQEVIFSADIKCEECQKRLADIMSRLEETESVLINVQEKKVTLTCRYPGVVKVSSKEVASIHRNPLGLGNKIATIKRIFRSSCSY